MKRAAASRQEVLALRTGSHDDVGGTLNVLIVLRIPAYFLRVDLLQTNTAKDVCPMIRKDRARILIIKIER